MNNNAAIIGPASLIAGFKALGFKTYPATTSQEAIIWINKLKTFTADQVALVIVAEKVVVDIALKDWIELSTNQSSPAIITIPCLETNLNLAQAKLDYLTEKAIGSKVSFKT